MAEPDTTVSELAAYKPLTPEQKALIDQVRGPLRALAKIVTVREREGDVEELTQIGLEVACKGIHKFDPSRGSFLTSIYVRAEFAMIDSLKAERRHHLEAKAALRASREVHASIDVGDILEESAEQRVERRDEALYAIAGASIIGMSLPPRTPEEMFIDEERRVLLSEVVEQELAKLDETDRRLVVMCTMEDSTTKDAAVVVGVEYERARERLRKASALVGRRLKRRLGE